MLRDIVREFVAQQREAEIERQYRDAYAKNPADELKDWADTGEWPEE